MTASSRDADSLTSKEKEEICLRAFQEGNYEDAVCLLSLLNNPKTLQGCRMTVVKEGGGGGGGTGANLLQAAASNGWLDIINDLITTYGFDPHVKDSNGRTCLYYGIYSITRRLDIISYFINVHKCDPMEYDYTGRTILHHASAIESTDVLRYLINEYNCDPMVTDNNFRSTPLHIAVYFGVRSNVQYLLSTGRCDPLAKDMRGNTPLALARKYHQSLLPLFNKFDLIKTSHPVDSYVNILLLGTPGAGKSTLNQVITDTAIGNIRFDSYRMVRGVELCTAGIIPTKLQHKLLGNIILHDFAGRSEYYSSHTAVIEDLVRGSGCVFIIVINITEKEALKHLLQWLFIVKNETQKVLNGHCRIIVVASHVDTIMDDYIKAEKSQMEKAIAYACLNEKVLLAFLDCRRLGGANMNSFLNSLSSACTYVCDTRQRSLSLYCHMMYGLLEEMKMNVVTLEEIVSQSSTSSSFIIPNEKEEVLDVLTSLHSTGLICLLKSEDGVWVVVNRQILLAEVNGILFAPITFKQYRTGFASNTGIMNVSTLSQLFPNYDVNMLICFFQYMTLAHEINPRFMTITNLSQLEVGKGVNEKLLFFPDLLDINTPPEIFNSVFQFGWCLQCINDHHFFPPRYFHALSLQLAYKMASPHQCTLWRNGIHWFNGHGICTLVEMVNDSQCVLVLMSNEEGYQENMVSARRDVIREIFAVHNEIYPSIHVDFNEYVIDPQEIEYPIHNPVERTVYRVKDIIKSLTVGYSFVFDTSLTRTIQLENLLQDENLTDYNNLSLLGGRDKQKHFDITRDVELMTSTITPVKTESLSDFNNDFMMSSSDTISPNYSQNKLPKHTPIPESGVYYKVLSMSIKESHISLEYLADKMLEKHVITETQRKEVIDPMSKLSDNQRLDLLIVKLCAAIDVDESLFDWLIQVLRDYSTVESTNSAHKLMERYEELKETGLGQLVLGNNTKVYTRKNPMSYGRDSTTSVSHVMSSKDFTNKTMPLAEDTSLITKSTIDLHHLLEKMLASELISEKEKQKITETDLSKDKKINVLIDVLNTKGYQVQKGESILLTEDASLITKSSFTLDYLLDKLLASELISDKGRQKITETGLSIDQRIDILIDFMNTKDYQVQLVEKVSFMDVSEEEYSFVKNSEIVEQDTRGITTDDTDFPKSNEGKILKLNEQLIEKDRIIAKKIKEIQSLKEKAASTEAKSIQCDHWTRAELPFKGMVTVGKEVRLYNAHSGHELLLEECGLKLSLPEGLLPPVTIYEVAAQGLWGGNFKFPEGTRLVSGVCYISISPDSSTNDLIKPITVQLTHCAHIVHKSQTEYLSFVSAQSDQSPFKFELLSGGVFSTETQYGIICLKKFSLIAIVLGVVGGVAAGITAATIAGAAVTGAAAVALTTGVAVTMGGELFAVAQGGHDEPNISEVPHQQEVNIHIEESFISEGHCDNRSVIEEDSTSQIPECFCRARIFHKKVTNEKMELILAILLDHKYLERPFQEYCHLLGVEQRSFRFKFSKKESRNGILKLSNFTQRDESKDGWKVTALIIPPSISESHVIDFFESRSTQPPTIHVSIRADKEVMGFKNNFQHTLNIEGIDVIGEEEPEIVIDISLNELSQVATSTLTEATSSRTVDSTVTVAANEDPLDPHLAVIVFRRHYAALLNLINPTNRLFFAAELYSKMLISDGCYDEATDSGTSSSNKSKSTLLMKGIRDSVISDPQLLKKLIDVLKEIDGESFQYIAEKIINDLQK